MPDQSTKSDSDDAQNVRGIQESLRITVRKRATFRSLFTKEDRRISSFIEIDDRSPESFQLLGVILSKLKDAKAKITNLDEEIQEFHSRLENDDMADMDFQEADVLSDNHALLINRLEEHIKILTVPPTSSSSDQNSHRKLSKHSAVKLPKMVLPTFDGDRRKWISFWDVFQSEIHGCDDISNISKFNFLRGQLSENVKKRVEGILASDANYDLLVKTLEDNYGNKTAIRNAHCVALCSIGKPQYTASSLRTFYDSVNGDVRSLSTLGLSDDTYGDFYVPILIEKLPADALTGLLEKYPDDNPSLQQLMEFIHVEVKKLEQVAYFNVQSNKIKPVNIQTKTPVNGLSHSTGSVTSMSASHQPKYDSSRKGKPFNRPTRNCSICKAQHNTFQCTMSTEDRMSAVQSANLCLNCLKPTHSVTQCPSRWRCSVCREPHHTSLHGAKAFQTSSKPTPTKQVQSGTTAFTQSLTHSDGLSDSRNSPVEKHRKFSPVLLKTATAMVQNDDFIIPANIFIDEGSSLTYTSTKFSSKLNIVPHNHCFVKIDTFGGKTIRQQLPVCSFDVITDDGSITIDTLLKDTIVHPINCEHWSECLDKPHLQGLTLADTFHHSLFEVDILLGVDSAWKFLKPDVISGFPTAQASSLGFILSGPLEPEYNGFQRCTQSLAVDSHNTEVISWLSPSTNDADLHQQVEVVLGFDNIGINNSTDELRDDGFIERFISQIEHHGHTYYAPLPWLDDHPDLPSNLSVAVGRLEQVKRRLLKLQLWDSYDKIIQDQRKKGYIETVEPDKEWNEVNCHYISHFFVLRSNSETTPLRVVFAANAGRTSLNDCLHTGPCLLRSLHELIHRFRTQKYAFVADIEKAFLRIKLLAEDKDYVRFLWYEDGDPNKPMKVYRYTSVFFGGTSSPFILNAVILYHLNRFCNTTDEPSWGVANDLRDKLYCDNVLSGQPDEESTVTYYKTSRDIMRSADMNLRQWFSNSQILQQLVKEESTGSTASSSGILGMEWDFSRDLIRFPKKALNIPNPGKLTKRQALSLASSVFDPIGLISPVTVPAKRFIASIWELELEWDQLISANLQDDFKDIMNEIEEAMQYSVPRYLNLDSSREVQLHTFCDACPNSAAAGTCFLVQDDNVVLVGSKLNSWSHVSSEDNVADLPSRGCLASELLQSTLWKVGPPWLTSPKDWPKWNPPDVKAGDKAFITLASVQSEKTSSNGFLSSLFDVSRFNSYDCLLHCAAYVIRFKNNCRNPEAVQVVPRNNEPAEIGLAELTSAENVILKAHQKEYFIEELKYLEKRAKTRPTLVRQLNLKLDTNGLICAPGRLEYVQLNDRARNPVMLAKSNNFTALIIQSIHRQQLHAGVNGTVVALRKSFWVPSARSQVARVLRKCITCKRNVGRPYTLPQSPPLPDFRLNKLKPFSSIGIDYTGNLIVKGIDKKRHKCYICLFACSTTRNVNLEVVTDLTADQFIQALRRHCAIYGVPEHIICDNAKTFVKADEDLQMLFKLTANDDLIKTHLTRNKIKLHHIPAKSPHWGGMYERIIGIIKLCLKKVLGRALVNLGELQTIIKEVQATVNDRPLTFVSNSTEDPEPLTPSKLLLGFDVTPLPHPLVDNDITDEDFSTHDSLNLAVKRRSMLYHHFVERFRSEYYSTLRERHVYQSKKSETADTLISVGDIVIVNSHDLPRLLWKLAIFQKLFRGKDGKVRAAQIRTNNGTSTRSIHLLYPLEVSLSDPDAFFKKEERNTEIPQIELRRSRRIAESSTPRPQYV